MAFLFFILSLAAASEPTKFGATLDPSCHKLVTYLTAEEAVEEFNKTVAHAYQDVTWCEYQYPELQPYTWAWRKKLREAEVFCDAKGDKDAAGYAKLRGPVFYKAVLYEPVRIHVVWRDNAELLLDDTPTGRAILIHELFHFTGANNQWGDAHAQIEMTSTDAIDTCRLNATRDRVSVLTSLCAGRREPRMKYPADIELYLRMRTCGDVEGCTKTFEEQLPWDQRMYWRSDALSHEKAVSLCQKIYQSGRCNSLRNGPDHDDYVAKEPHLFEVRKLVNERVNFSRKEPSMIVKREFLAQHPALEAGYRSLKSSWCFEAAVFTLENGDLFLERSEEHSTWWTAFTNMQKNPRCSKADRNAVLSWVDAVEQERRAQPFGSLSEFTSYDRETRRKFEKDLQSPKIREFLGEDLAKQVLKTYRRYHPDWPGWVCPAQAF